MLKRIIILILIFTVACSSQTSERPVSILDVSSCELPCWNGITPGKTSEQEAIEILRNTSVVNDKSILVRGVPWNGFDNSIFFTFDAPYKSRQNQEILILNGLVTNLDLCGELHRTIGQIIEKIGNPELVIIVGIIHGAKIVMLVNPKEGVSYWYDLSELPKEFDSQILPDIEVGCIGLFDTDSYEIMLERGMFAMGHGNAEETLKMAYPWNGYGNVYEKYPPKDQ